MRRLQNINQQFCSAILGGGGCGGRAGGEGVESGRFGGSSAADFSLELKQTDKFNKYARAQTPRVPCVPGGEEKPALLLLPWVYSRW